MTTETQWREQGTEHRNPPTTEQAHVRSTPRRRGGATPKMLSLAATRPGYGARVAYCRSLWRERGYEAYEDFEFCRVLLIECWDTLLETHWGFAGLEPGADGELKVVRVGATQIMLSWLGEVEQWATPYRHLYPMVLRLRVIQEYHQRKYPATEDHRTQILKIENMLAKDLMGFFRHKRWKEPEKRGWPTRVSPKVLWELLWALYRVARWE